jgi:hypothetical protein
MKRVIPKLCLLIESTRQDVDEQALSLAEDILAGGIKTARRAQRPAPSASSQHLPAVPVGV